MLLKNEAFVFQYIPFSASDASNPTTTSGSTSLFHLNTPKKSESVAVMPSARSTFIILCEFVFLFFVLAHPLRGRAFRGFASLRCFALNHYNPLRADASLLVIRVVFFF